MVHGSEKSKLARQRPSVGPGGPGHVPDLFGETTGSTRWMCYALLARGLMAFLGTLLGSYHPDLQTRVWLVAVGVAEAPIALVAPFLVARRRIFGLSLAWAAFCCLIAQTLMALGTVPSILHLSSRMPNDGRDAAGALVLVMVLIAGGLEVVILVGLVSRDTAIYLRLPKPLSQDEEDAAEADSSQAP